MDYTELSHNHSRRDGSRNRKPCYVRRLNFAPSILELDTVQQCSTLNRSLLIDQNVSHIPCMNKSDYVRKWIETHKNSECNLTDELSQSQSVAERSATKTVETSPIIGGSEKRRRRKIRINRRIVVKSADNADCQENAGQTSYRTQSEPDCDNGEKNESERARSVGIRCTPPCSEQVTDSSPVLGNTYVLSRKRKRKRSLCVPKDATSSKYLNLDDKANIKVNPKVAGSNNNLDALKKVFKDYEKVEKDFSTNIKAGLVSGRANKSLERCEVMFSSPERLQDRLSFRDSLSSDTNKDSPKIETGTSDDKEADSKDERYNEISSIKYSSDKTDLSNIIEDTDTQEVVKTSQLSIPNKSVNPSRQLLRSNTSSINETYCSEAEITYAQSMQLSTKISQVPSLKENTQKTGNKSTQSDAIISSITTPSKKSLDKSIHAHLLDSGKKRRKPKKGSMVARLQSLVNAQVSGIRIWHHRMNKNPHDAASAEYISVLVCGCTEQFGNQFLDGILIEDRFNLLQSDVEIEEAESRHAQGSMIRPKKTLPRRITVMLVCDIVGTLKMTSRIVINVYLPWNILDKDDLTLEASYININNNCEIPDIPDAGNSRKRKKRVIKEFNCPCIEERREMPFCARKPKGDKPDVMQRIFDF